jgi:agmatine deiminase
VATYLDHLPADRLLLQACASDDTWARDHGGITVETASGPQLLDFIFNGWGNKFSASRDNQITSCLHQAKVFGEAPIHSIPLVLEGGSIESDGKGTLLTTSACLLSPERNPHLSKDEIEKALTQFLGAQNILWLDHGALEGDDTDAHIDTLARFCQEDTIAYVACDDPTDPHYKELRAMQRQLAGFRQKNGKPYRLIPLPWPAACYAADGHRLPATYANFLITNGALIVPIYGLPQDEEALKILEQTFPEREVVGVNCRPLIEQHGSLHCVTMQYPASLFKKN